MTNYDLSQTLLALQNKAKRIRSDLDQARGRKKGLLESLDSNFSLESLKEAKAYSKKLNNKYEIIRKKINLKANEINEKYYE